MADATRRFTQMYDAHRQQVWAYAVSRAGRQVADEVVSETFAIAWRRLDDIPAPALPWLLGVARNVLRDSVRAEVRRASLAAETRSWARHPAGEAVGDVAEDVAERLALLAALAALSDADREVLTLTAWQGLAPAEAARVVGCTTAALRVRLHRARRRLERALGEDGGSPVRTPPPPSTAVRTAAAPRTSVPSAPSAPESPVLLRKEAT
ncbi:RNA polymerase sigma factor [Streptomyces polyrhachis]|uniref:RNA polymerase sigma factor n=1 Tax=Streptomyces polyrhachis TaxID=1282885 RepID=A0ABW2G854_9ACTN